MTQDDRQDQMSPTETDMRQSEGHDFDQRSDVPIVSGSEAMTEAPDVQRFEPLTLYDGEWTPYTQMDPTPTGDWVRFSDYEAAINSLTEAQAELPSYWVDVIGTEYKPTVLKGLRYLHPKVVKPIFDKHFGTEVADVIVGLIFAQHVAANRAQIAFDWANEKRARAEAAESELERAERERDEARETNREFHRRLQQAEKLSQSCIGWRTDKWDYFYDKMRNWDVDQWNTLVVARAQRDAAISRAEAAEARANEMTLARDELVAHVFVLRDALGNERQSVWRDAKLGMTAKDAVETLNEWQAESDFAFAAAKRALGETEALARAADAKVNAMLEALRVSKTMAEALILEIEALPAETFGVDSEGDGTVPGGMQSWPRRDEILHYLRRDLGTIDAALALEKEESSRERDFPDERTPAVQEV